MPSDVTNVHPLKQAAVYRAVTTFPVEPDGIYTNPYTLQIKELSLVGNL